MLLACAVLFEPFDQRGHTDARRPETLVIKTHQRLFLNEQIAPTGAGLELLHRAHQGQVVAQKCRRLHDVARNQRIADKNIPRGGGIDLSKVHPSTIANGQAIQRHPLLCHHPTTATLPRRFVVMPLQHIGIHPQ